MIRFANEELPVDSLAHPRLQVVFQHWNAVRGGAPMPARRLIDPLALKGALGVVMIARHDPAIDDYRYSLFGTEIVRGQQSDFTSRLASQLEPKPYADIVLATYRQAHASGCPYYGRIVLSADGGEPVSYYRLVLPLGDNGRTVDGLLVASENEKAFWQALHDWQRDLGDSVA